MFRLATNTAPLTELCHFEELGTFEAVYPLAVKVWNALTTLHESRHCDGIQECIEIAEDNSPEIWHTVLKIDYLTHER